MKTKEQAYYETEEQTFPHLGWIVFVAGFIGMFYQFYLLNESAVFSIHLFFVLLTLCICICFSIIGLWMVFLTHKVTHLIKYQKRRLKNEMD